MNDQRMNISTCVFLVMALLVLFVCPSACAVQTLKQIVKVAYYNMGDYYEELSDGIVDSYDTEMLNRIEQYSNLTFEYVNCGTWGNALKMLDQHEVDLVGTVQWTNEREALYEFCLEGYGYTIGELAALPDRGYIYEEYDAIGKSVIGCTTNYVRMEEMKRLFAEHGISPVMKYYDTQLQLENASELGEVDLIAANSHTLKNNYVVMEKFTFSPFFSSARRKTRS